MGPSLIGLAFALPFLKHGRGCLSGDGLGRSSKSFQYNFTCCPCSILYVRSHLKLQAQLSAPEIPPVAQLHLPFLLLFLVRRSRIRTPASGAFLLVADPRVPEYEAQPNMHTRPKVLIPVCQRDQGATSVFIRNYVLSA